MSKQRAQKLEKSVEIFTTFSLTVWLQIFSSCISTIYADTAAEHDCQFCVSVLNKFTHSLFTEVTIAFYNDLLHF